MCHTVPPAVGHVVGTLLAFAGLANLKKFGGRKSRLLPDEGRRCLGSGMCARLQTAASLGLRGPVFVFGPSDEPCYRRPGLSATGLGAAPEAGRWGAAADEPSSPWGQNLPVFLSEVWAKMPRLLSIPFLPSSSDHFQNVTSIILVFIAPWGSRKDFFLVFKKTATVLWGGKIGVRERGWLEPGWEPRSPGLAAACLGRGREGRSELRGKLGFWICGLFLFINHVLWCVSPWGWGWEWCSPSSPGSCFKERMWPWGPGPLCTLTHPPRHVLSHTLHAHVRARVPTRARAHPCSPRPLTCTFTGAVHTHSCTQPPPTHTDTRHAHSCIRVCRVPAHTGSHARLHLAHTIAQFARAAALPYPHGGVWGARVRGWQQSTWHDSF